MGNYFWLKLKKDFYKRHDMIILEAMENGKEIELIYIKMLCEAIDHNGELRFNDHIAYTPRLLAPVFNTTEEMIKTSLSVLTDLELIDIKEDGTIQMTKMGSFIGYETDMAEKKKMQRNLPTLKNGSKRLNGTTLVTPDMRKHHVDEKRYGGHGMQALDRAFGKCEKCGSNKDVRIHHNNGYSNELDDLVCLCFTCHCEAHKKKNGGHVDIERPPYVHQLSTTCPDTTGDEQDMCKTNVCPDIEIDKEIDIEKDKEIEREKRGKREKADDGSSATLSESKKRFSPPTVEEVAAYCEERKNGIDPQRFWDFYASKNWMIGKSKMKDWKAAVRTWEAREDPKKKRKPEDVPFMQNEYSAEHLKQKEIDSMRLLDALLEE